MRGVASYTTSHFWGNIIIEWLDDGDIVVTNDKGVKTHWSKDTRREHPF